MRLRLNSTFLVKHVSELILLGDGMSSVSVDKFVVVGSNVKNG